MKHISILLIILFSLTYVNISAQDWISNEGIHKIHEYESTHYYIVKGLKNKKVSKKGFSSIEFMKQPNNALALEVINSKNMDYKHILIDKKGKKITVTPLGYSKIRIPKNYNYVDGDYDRTDTKLLYNNSDIPGIYAKNIAFLNDYGKPCNFLDNVVSGYFKKISKHFFFETVTKTKDTFLVVTNEKGVLQNPPLKDYYRFSVRGNWMDNDNFDNLHEVYAIPHPENNELIIPIMANGSPAPMLENNIIGYLPFYDDHSAIRLQAKSALIDSWIGVHAMDDGSFKYSYASPNFEYQTPAVFINTDWTFQQEWFVKSYFLYGEESPGKYGLYWFDTVDKSHWYYYKRVDDKDYDKYSVVSKINNIKYDLEAPKRRYQDSLRVVAEQKARQKKWDEEYRAERYKEFLSLMSKGDTYTAKKLAVYLKGKALAKYCSRYKCSPHQIREAMATSEDDSYYNQLHSQLQYRTNTGTENWHKQLTDWSNDLDEQRAKKAANTTTNMSQVIKDGMKTWSAQQQSKTNSIKRKTRATYTENLKNWTYGKQNWKPAKPND